jgi:HlyD family secretion protein
VTRTTKITALAVGGAAVVAAAVAFWQFRARGSQPEYVTAEVKRGRIEAGVTATGTLNAVTTVQVGTYVSGRIQEIHADYNSKVQRGQLIAKIDPAPFIVKVQQAEARLATARARVQKARAELEFRRANIERQRRLLAQRIVSQDDFDAATNQHAQAESQLVLEEASVKEAEAALAEARVNLDYCDIVSPVDGVVLSRTIDVGQTVAASFQTPTLFIIAEDLTKMQVDTNVSESDIGQVQSGQNARFVVDAYPDRVFHGAVSQVRNDPLIVQNVVTYDVIVEVDNSDLALKPGLTATVTIVAGAKEDVLSVPSRALRFRPRHDELGGSGPGSDGEGPSVYVLDDGELKRIGVEVGMRSEDSAEISSPALRSGDRVVVAYRRREELQ